MAYKLINAYRIIGFAGRLNLPCMESLCNTASSINNHVECNMTLQTAS